MLRSLGQNRIFVVGSLAAIALEVRHLRGEIDSGGPSRQPLVPCTSALTPTRYLSSCTRGLPLQWRQYLWMRWQFPAVLTRCSSNILTGSIRRKRDFAFDMRTLYLGNTREEVLRTLGRLFERIDKLRLNIRERGLVFEISRRINAIGRYFRLHYVRMYREIERNVLKNVSKWNINYMLETDFW